MTHVGFWAEALWVTIGLGLVLYALTGGADLGAGVWNLLARGRLRESQRHAIQHALGPIWETNHVWLIFVIVVLFSAFPRAFAMLSIALHVPIALALIGIVLRGAAFSFHAYGIQSDATRERWSHVFAWSSCVTPVLLGTIVGAVSSGDIRVSQRGVTTGFIAGWTSPFALLVGSFALALFALLSACYLAAETGGEIAADFGRKALASEVVAGLLAVAVFVAAGHFAPELLRRFTSSAAFWPLQVATAAFAACTGLTLWRGQYRIARFTVAAQVGLVVVGWGVGMDRHFIVPDVSIATAGARPEVLPALTVTFALGAVVLAPALFYLYRVFKLSSQPPER